MALTLTPKLPQHGVPRLELPDTTLFLTVFKISRPIFQLYGNKSKDLQAGILALQGERVNKYRTGPMAQPLKKKT